jgi:hypothetical protein
MHRSSESIASLAAALAKAQAELVNPEKSLTATIRSDDRRGTEQTFRYAPLSSGLDIVRKTLGQHEIATIQTTAIDQAAGLVNLTTVLAHASGEWIASDWPVCAISETATPHRMGAALTYARRYALFTLVGIAGEDDVDAPDLLPPEQQTSGPEKPKGNGSLNGGQHQSASRAVAGSAPKTWLAPVAPALGPEASAKLRDRLLHELNELASGDEAALWAYRSLPAKNRLIAADADRVEQAFQARMTSFASPVEPQTSGQTDRAVKPHKSKPVQLRKRRSQPKGIDKSALHLAEPRRVRDREHVRHVAKQPCLICGRSPSDPHHLRFAQSRALGRKVSDEFVVPLCRGHHREVHRFGDEAAWWRKAGIDATVAARTLWLETKPIATDPDKLLDKVVEATTAHPTGRAYQRRDRRVGDRRENRKSKLGEVTVPHGNA